MTKTQREELNEDVKHMHLDDNEGNWALASATIIFCVVLLVEVLR